MQHGARVLGLVVALAVFVGVGRAFAADGNDVAPLTKAQLQSLYSEYLVEEGYKPKVDEDGDVQFKREGRLYFIAVSEADPQFFRIALPNIWEIESDEERAKVLVAADASNAKSKVSKTFTVKDNVWVNIEIFVAKPEDFKVVFERALSALDNGVDLFVTKMRE